MKLKRIFSFIFLNVSSVIAQCDNLPPLNKEIISFVDSNLNKKVDRGECWDLAAGALVSVKAKWDGNYNFGKEIKIQKECVYPGDVIQFEGVVLKYKMDEVVYTEKLAHHTAIIYQVNKNLEFVIADQNTRFSGKKVGKHIFNVKDVTKGKFIIYRPVK